MWYLLMAILNAQLISPLSVEHRGKATRIEDPKLCARYFGHAWVSECELENIKRSGPDEDDTRLSTCNIAHASYNLVYSIPLSPCAGYPQTVTTFCRLCWLKRIRVIECVPREHEYKTKTTYEEP